MPTHVRFSPHAWVEVGSDLVLLRRGGPMGDNSFEIYPDSIMVEYLVLPPPEDEKSVSDWSALRLVFEPEAGHWLLVGVIHHEQTI